MSLFNIKGVLNPLTGLSQLSRKPHTLLFPKIEVPAAARYRGLHYNDVEYCIGCGNCAEICMNKAIDMIPLEGVESKKGDSGLRPRVDNGRCCWCGLCVDVCPTGSLSLTTDYIFVSPDPNEFLWTPGISNPEGKDKRSWVSSDLNYSINTYDRVPMPMLDPEERVKSFAEVVLGYEEEQARQEAQRCLSCGLCTEACPEHMHIPEYINAIARGADDDSLRIIYDNNPLPETCGKVCTRRCEEICALAKRGEPVAIRWLKRYATERALNADEIKEIVNPPIAPKNGKRVAVIGAGPAGLTVAYYLALRGFDVEVYERNSRAGGMTMYGIPKYRLPLDSLDKQVQYMEKVGVKFHFNTEIGKDVKFEDLYNNFDAVFVGVGLQDAWKLGVEGEELKGVWGAIHFLRRINEGERIDVGDRVVVVGGGNTAIDAARVSRRLGAEVIMLYRRRKQDMPADWEEIEDAEAEGVQIWPQGLPVKVIGDEQGKVKALRYIKTKMVPNPQGGRPKPVPIEGSEEDIQCSTVIAAIGQDADYSLFPESYREKIEFNRGRIVVNEWGQTGDPKIFAGGDAVNRVADAISAIADGYRAVKGIVRYLLGEEALKHK